MLSDATREPAPGADDDLDDALQRVANLETALLTSRTIGIAIGILMERRKLSVNEAFALLSTASNHERRKLRDVASDIVFTGEVPA